MRRRLALIKYSSRIINQVEQNYDNKVVSMYLELLLEMLKIFGYLNFLQTFIRNYIKMAMYE